MAWYATAAERHGAKAIKGRVGEDFFIEAYKALGWDVIDKEGDFKHQISGVDVVIEKGDKKYGVDVKNNMKDDGTIVVEIQDDGWLFKPCKIAKYISHVNPTTKMIATYTRAKMQQFVKEEFKHLRNKGKKEIVFIAKKDVPPFVKWTTIK